MQKAKCQIPAKQRTVMLMINPPIPLRYDGIVRYAREHGWRLTIANRLVRAPSGWNGDGALVTLRGDAETTRFVKGLVERGIPVVDLTSYMPEIDVPRVIPDYREAGCIAAGHFHEIGLKHAAWFSTIWTNVHSLFFEGLASRWSNAEKIVLSDSVPVSKLDDIDRFEQVMKPRLKALPKPIGILTYNDEEATRLLSLCLETGIAVPDEIAILGIGNDTFLCENQPIPISSVIDDLESNGYAAAKLLDDLMPPSPRATEKMRRLRRISPILVPCKGIAVRRSTDTLAVENPILRKALEILKSSFVNPPSTIQLAETLGISRATIDRLFSFELGRTMHSEIMRLKLAKAKDMLSSGDASIGEIADACGFCNPGHFVNSFSRAFGSPPGKWRHEKSG